MNIFFCNTSLHYFSEAVRDKAAGGVEELIVEPSVEAIPDKAAGRVEEPGVESPVEAVREAAEEVKRLSLVDRP